MNVEMSHSHTRSGAIIMPQSDRSPSEELLEKIHSFSMGNSTVLKTPELVDTLAQHVFSLYNNGSMGEALILLEQLGEASVSDIVIHRERSLIILSLVAEKVLEEDNEDLLEAIAHTLMRWLKTETEFNGGFEYICLQLSNLLQRMLELNLWYQAESLIAALYDIRKDGDNKNRLLYRVISRIHGKIAENSILDKLIGTYVDQTDDKSDVAGSLLVLLGDKSTPQLLGTLSQCQDKTQRFRLLDLIPEAGEDAVPSLVEELGSTPSWYYARNIIHLLTRIGDPELFAFVEPFMEHKDIRVQQEVIECAKKINSDGLLKALNVCDDSLKPNLVRTLGPLKGPKIAKAFIGLLDNYTIFEKHLQDEIVREVCNFIHLYPGEKTEQSVEFLLNDYKEFKHFNKHTYTAIEYAYVALQNGIEVIESEQEVSEAQATESGNVPPSVEDKASTYQDSESLDWFNELRQSQETPEHTKKHLLHREDFYNTLSHEEFLAFSSLLVHEKFKTGDILTTTGDAHSKLYFIESGKISLEFPDDGGEVSLRKLKTGDIFGHEIFMTGSEWPVSLKADTESEVFIFDQEQLLNLQPNYPQLCQKILEYSKNSDIILRLFKAANYESLCYSDGEPIAFKSDIDDHIANIKIIDQFSQGLCFCFELPVGIEYSIFSERELTLFFDTEPSKPMQISARTIGLKFYEKSNRRLCVFAKFIEETDISGYTCTHISL